MSKILSFISRLRELTQVDLLHGWMADQVVCFNDKGFLIWPKGGECLILSQSIVIPEYYQGYRVSNLKLRLALTWWADLAEVYVNDRLVGVGDLFDCRVRLLLCSDVCPGDVFHLRLRLVSPDHAEGGLMRSFLIYEADELLVDPGFLADELSVVSRFADLSEVGDIDFSVVGDRCLFGESLCRFRQGLSAVLKDYTIYLLGHAHLDLAWLWPIEETWKAAQNTIESVLGLQEDFPDLIYTHSSPVLYRWIEIHRPDLFRRIVEKVNSGHWEIAAGFWVEPELNLISAESMVRQLFYGIRYCRQKFPDAKLPVDKIAWVPDSFGFGWQVPQVLSQAGIKYFVTQKLRWNDSNKFPYGFCWWEGLDGSRVLCFMSGLIGEGFDPVRMGDYLKEWNEQTGLNEALHLLGVGDHGGGPTRDMLELKKAWSDSPFFPNLEFRGVYDFLEGIGSDDLPVWRDELYLEFHRGCYTTHADQKLSNRRAEELLYEVELFCSVTHLMTGLAYPQSELDGLWERVLFNQFHDILPGTSIPEVFREANRGWDEVLTGGKVLLESALNELVCLLGPCDDLSFVIFNPLNWEVCSVVGLEVKGDYLVFDAQGEELIGQRSGDTLYVRVTIPPVGYARVSLRANSNISIGDNLSRCQVFDGNSGKDWVLEHDLLRVEVDPNTGNLIQIYDKVNDRKVLNDGGGNVLECYRDEGQYWDAWNIDPGYENCFIGDSVLIDQEWIDRGPLLYRMRVRRQVAGSVFVQDYQLELGSRVLKIITSVDWRESHKLVKAVFNLAVGSEYATYEIGGGAISRPTRGGAKWEVPGFRWADLGSDDYGVSLLNDCKYGYDAKFDQLRLTLLRSPLWPDPMSDRGEHNFVYGIYPHEGSWKKGNTVRRGMELNYRPLVVSGSGSGANLLPPWGSFFDLGSDNLVLMAFKRKHDDQSKWILRFYESLGESTDWFFSGCLGLRVEGSVNLLEEGVDDQGVGSFSIRSFVLGKGE